MMIIVFWILDALLLFSFVRQVAIDPLNLWAVIYLFLLAQFNVMYLFCLRPISLMRPKEAPFKYKFQNLLMRYVLIMKSAKSLRLDAKNKMPDPTSSDDVDVEIIHYSIEDDDDDDDDDPNTKLQINYFKRSGTKMEDIRKVIVFFHSGGFVFGHPNQLTRFIETFFSENEKEVTEDILFAAAEYRKCPEVKLSQIEEDAKRQLQNVSEYVGGWKEKKLVLAGSSAGGKLAIVLSHYLRDKDYDFYGLRREDLHLTLFYPGICYSEKFVRDLESRKKFENGIILNNWIVRYFYRNGVYYEKGKEFSAFRNMKNLPSMVIYVGEWDYLYSECEKYVQMVRNEQQKGDDNNGEEEFTEFVALEREFHGFLLKDWTVDKGNFGRMSTSLADNIKKRFD